MASVEDTVGLISFETKATGFYQLCLGNYKNHFGGVRVFVNFGVYYEGAEEMRRQAKEGEKVLNNTLSNIEASINKIQNQVVQMWRHYSYARMRRGADHYLLLSNSNYVTWWSAAQSVVIVVAGYLQLFFLKRLFHTNASRPRC
ncbi:transmembrane emp24 domain-containing protein 6 isoform X2 [Esox lucius]|nr:transmembrane emp24 domain-containing protein 6 isoform X2 [Esox lucius]